MTLLFRILPLFFLALPCSASIERPGFVTVVPQEDTRAVLHNPDMGWVLYENYPLDAAPSGSSTLITLPNEGFATVDSVALMFSWFDIEKQKGQYDFSKVDFAYDYWKRRGKQIQLRLSTESLLWWTMSSNPSGKGIPDYVLAQLPPGKKQTRLAEGIPYAVVDARESFYKMCLRKFLHATAAHFTGERSVTLVDLRAFGLWGEWHTGYQYASLPERQMALQGIIDAFIDAFPNQFLALSYSYDPDSPKRLWDGPTKAYNAAFSRTYEEFLSYSAFDYALTKPNVTWRRDGTGGAVHSNERKLNQEAFLLHKGPMMCEFLGGYEANKKAGAKWLQWIVEDALSLHPNYINLLGYQSGDALAFLKEQPELVNKGLRNMGYRLVPTKAVFPSQIKAGAPVHITMQWVNRGVGRALRDYRLKLLLSDSRGEVAACDAGPLDTASWIKGERYATSKEVTFHAVPDGSYNLSFALIDTQTQKTIALPLYGTKADGSYPLGSVRCMATASPHS